MTPLRKRMMADMQLKGLATRTQESYARAVQGIAKYYNKSPAEMSEGELRGYLLYLKDEKKDGAKHVKMSWIKHDKQIMEKVSDSDIENFVQSAKQKFSK